MKSLRSVVRIIISLIFVAFLSLNAVTYHFIFEMGMSPRGMGEIYNNEYWGEDIESLYIPVTVINLDRKGVVYYSIFNIEMEYHKFFVGGGMKTFAENSIHSETFSPYRVRYNVNIGYHITDEIQIGFNHLCTHTFVDLSETLIYQSMWEEIYIRIEK